MILLTLGTHEQPFARALDLVRPLAAHEEVLVQHGHTPPRPGEPGMAWVEFVDRETMQSLVRDASAVICHAGVGCIVTAIAHGKTPIVIPRLSRHGEHVDDHQLQIAAELAAAGMVVTCPDGAELDLALAEARSRKPALRRSGDLRHAVAEATSVDLARPLPFLRSVVGLSRTH